MTVVDSSLQTRSIYVAPQLPNLDSIYTAAWKQRLADYFAHGNQFASAGRYWAFDFQRQWRKHRTAVVRELDLVRRIEHWMPAQGRKVLVMGSWLGAEAIAYALSGAEVTAIDLDEQALALSEELALAYGVRIEIRKLDAAATGLPAEKFDLVSCSQVMEHLPPTDQPKLLAEMWRVCAAGGLLWLDTPNQLNPRDQHDTGLYFVHWLPRGLKTRLARMVGRDVPTHEPAFGFQAVGLHYYVSYFRLLHWLGELGDYQLLSRYRGFADVDHYAMERRLEGRGDGAIFGLKLALMRTMMPVWNFNWMSDIRLVIRKVKGR